MKVQRTKTIELIGASRYFNWTFGLLQTAAKLITGLLTLVSTTLIGQLTHLT